MKILENTLKAKWERWDDPGDYPNNVASGPLPSHDFIESIDGHVLLKIEDDIDLIAFNEDFGDDLDVPEGVKVTSWDITLLPDWTIELTVTEFTE